MTTALVLIWAYHHRFTCRRERTKFCRPCDTDWWIAPTLLVDEACLFLFIHRHAHWVLDLIQ